VASDREGRENATPLIGCHAMVLAGKVDGVLCID
jgi:hypothetical protein